MCVLKILKVKGNFIINIQLKKLKSAFLSSNFEFSCTKHRDSVKKFFTKSPATKQENISPLVSRRAIYFQGRFIDLCQMGRKMA